jgi:hypothetical protein
MSIAALVRAGLFNPPKKVKFNLELLTDEHYKKLFETKILRVASTKTFRVVDIIAKETETSYELEFEELSVHLKDTGWMANRSVENMIAYLGCDLTVDVDYWLHENN